MAQITQIGGNQPIKPKVKHNTLPTTKGEYAVDQINQNRLIEFFGG